LLCTSKWQGFSCIDDLTIHICRSPACEQKCPWLLRQRKSQKGIFPAIKNTFIKRKIGQHGRRCKMFSFVHNKPQSTNGLIRKSSQFFEVHLTDVPDSITWKLSNSSVYSSELAYLAQFETPPTSFMMPTVWENWAPLKLQIFCMVDPSKPSVDGGPPHPSRLAKLRSLPTL
jgi:hypothetical protein